MKKLFLIAIVAIGVLFWLLFGGGWMALAGIWLKESTRLPDFIAYESPIELNGSSVKKSELFYTDEESIAEKNFTYVQTYGSGIALTERQSKGWVPCDQRGYQSIQDISVECNEESIKSGGRYSVSIFRRNNIVTDITVSAEINGTDLWIGIREDHIVEFTEYDGWQQYFDAMRPKDLTSTPYEYRSYGL